MALQVRLVFVGGDRDGQVVAVEADVDIVANSVEGCYTRRRVTEGVEFFGPEAWSTGDCLRRLLAVYRPAG